MSGPSALLSRGRLPGAMKRVCWLVQAGCAHGLKGVQQADMLTLLVKLRSPCFSPPNVAVLLFPAPIIRTPHQHVTSNLPATTRND